MGNDALPGASLSLASVYERDLLHVQKLVICFLLFWKTVSEMKNFRDSMRSREKLPRNRKQQAKAETSAIRCVARGYA